MRWAPGRCAPSVAEPEDGSAQSGGRMRRTASVLGAVSAALLASSGCISSESCDAVLCGPLPPAVTASVRDSLDGGIVHAAVVNGFPFDCASHCPVLFPDGGMPEAAGPAPLAVSAPGYASHSETVQVPTREDDSCCPLRFQPQAIDVALTPL